MSNKLDTELREHMERFIMARRKFDKQFKNSAVKLNLDEGYSVKEVCPELDVPTRVSSVGFKRLKNMARMLFLAMGQL